VSVSGGITCPEGSIFIIPLLILVSVGILFTLPRTGGGYASKIASRRLDFP
jgi:hypothetical protein